jgi:dienelactone hydrolase
MKIVFSVCCVALVWSVLLLNNSTDAADPVYSSVVRQKTPGGVEYGMWGNPTTRPAPTLFMLAGTVESTLEKPYFRQCGNELADLGYLVVSLDLPCHGDQSIEGEPAGLSGWSHQVGQNVDFVAASNARLSEVLDHLIATGLTDPNRVAAGGTSRGGFLAIHFAAHDRRVKCAAGFAPVTDLAALSEFRSRTEHPLVAKLNLTNQTEQLAGRPVWIVIGDRDERVGTQHAIELASRLSAVAKERNIASNVELHVMSEPRGHTTPQGSSSIAADWVHRHLSSEVDPASTDSPH